MDIIFSHPRRNIYAVASLEIIPSAPVFQIPAPSHDEQRVERTAVAPELDLPAPIFDAENTKIVALEQTAEPSLFQAYFVIIKYLGWHDRRAVDDLDCPIDMKFPVIPILVLAQIVIHAECRIRALLDLGDHHPSPDRVYRTRVDKKHVPRMHFDPVQHVTDRAIPDLFLKPIL